MNLSDTTHPPQKRRRENEGEDNESASNSSPVITRSTAFWCDDGNIIIQVEDTQYRVHKSVLSRHSRFFKDLFTLPQPPGEDMVEGCQVVRMQGDRSSEWVDLLTLMYNPLQNHRVPKDYPISVLISMLRLGHKYQIDHFRDAAADCSKKFFPTTLAEWDESSLFSPYDTNGSVVDALGGHGLDLINTALEVGLNTILPITYYLCLRDLGFGPIFDGIRRMDGSISCLTHETRRLLVTAHHKIFSAALEHPLKPLRGDKHIPAKSCTTPDMCRVERSRLLEDGLPMIFKSVDCALGDIDELDPENLCGYCKNCYNREAEVGRSTLWDQLPLFFELPGWGELKDFQ